MKKAVLVCFVSFVVPTALSGLTRWLRARVCRVGAALLLGFTGLLPSLLAAETTNQTALLLGQIARSAGRVDSVFTRFEQERHLSLFEEPLRSEGFLCFQKPGRIRWEVAKPYQSILVSDGKGVAQFERVNDQWKKLDLGLADAMQNVMAQISAVMDGSYAAKQRDYSVTATNAAEGPVVTLTPRNPAMQKMMRAIEIHLAPDFMGTRRVVLREVGGDYTDIRFSGQVASPPLPAGTFDRAKPADLEQILRSVEQAGKAPVANPPSQ